MFWKGCWTRPLGKGSRASYDPDRSSMGEKIAADAAVVKRVIL